MEQVLYLCIGLIAGILAGLFGIGGGIVVVPLLAMQFKQQGFPDSLIMHMAVGTSLAIMIFTAISSAYAYQRRGLVFWPLFYKFIPGLLLGTVLGSLTAQLFTSESLRMAFGLLILIIAMTMLFPRKVRPTQSSPPHTIIIILMSMIIGICSGFFGIGGGTMMVPFFVYCQIEMHKATGTSALCGFPLAIIGTLSLMLIGWHTAVAYQAPIGTTGYIYWPAALIVAFTSMLFAPLGTRLAVWLPSKILKRCFAVILLVTAVNLLWPVSS